MQIKPAAPVPLSSCSDAEINSVALIFFEHSSRAREAMEAEDCRFGLQALDRVRGSLEQLMKAHGLLQPDGAITTIDNRKQVTQVAREPSAKTSQALIAGSGQLALTRGKIGTPLRDVESFHSSRLPKCAKNGAALGQLQQPPFMPNANVPLSKSDPPLSFSKMPSPMRPLLA